MIISILIVVLQYANGLSSHKQQIHRQDLIEQQWQFRESNSSVWYNSSGIPSTLHMDLMKNGLIEDPYLELNQLKMYELELKDWEYQTTFNVEFEMLSVFQLVFEGLDTYAQVYLNGRGILNASNMHREWKVDVSDLIKEQNNSLRIHFKSAVRHDMEMEILNGDLNLPFNYTYSRKASYQYGWDWGPRIVTCGIWKPIYIQTYHLLIIESAYLKTLQIVNEQAKIQFFIQLTGGNNIGNNWHNYHVMIHINDTAPINFVINQPIHHIDYTLHNPQLWWPHQQGNQSLYHISITLHHSNNIIHQYNFTTGIRIAKWIQSNDTQGSSFKLNLNGRDIYVKGANYIPPDMFMPRVYKNQTIYHKIIKNAIRAGYNTLRLWGGGQFEYDILYELADQYGILIWHDLMFACALYPGNEEFLRNVAHEIYDNVKRLRIHPSIIMWNGNNEVEIGWREWGWKENRTDQQIQLLEQWYHDLFLKLIPSILEEIDPTTFYWPTSPSTSFQDPKALEFGRGDIHFWGVWASSYDIETYRTYIGRFNSEYGMQAMIGLSSIKKFSSNSSDWQLDSLTMQIHERHVLGFVLLRHYLQNYIKSQELKQFIHNIYGTQLVQYYALETAITALRGAKPYNMGSLYWQINDVWPVFSWSTVDYYGCWKAGHYAAKRYHSDPLVTFIPLNETYGNVLLISDLPDKLVGNVSVFWNYFNGTNIESHFYSDIEVIQERPTLIQTFQFSNQLQNYTYIQLSFSNSEGKGYRGTYTFGRPLGLELKDPKISLTYHSTYIEIRSQSFAKSVYLFDEDECAQVSDNFFDLMPGTAQITYNINNYQGELKLVNYMGRSLEVLSLWDIQHSE